MTLDLKDAPSAIGNFLIVGLHGTSLKTEERELLSKVRPAGILLYERNLKKDGSYDEWFGALDALIKDVKQCIRRDKLIISIDHEGGRVHRTPAPFTKFPAPAKYAKRASDVGTAMAIELRSLGVNLSWSPLADIHSNPSNPVIGDRAFGTTPDEVSKPAIEMAKALEASGVLPCAKHFPGHGDTSTDSHYELPFLDFDEKTLRERELLPFQALVKENVPFIMTAHVHFRSIDKENPATLSKKLLHDILEVEFGYKGIVIADDVGMEAVADIFSGPSGLAKAFEAGCHMFIASRHPGSKIQDPLVTLPGFLERGLATNTISSEVLRKAYGRVDELLKNRLPMHKPEKLPQSIFENHARLKASI